VAPVRDLLSAAEDGEQFFRTGHELPSLRGFASVVFDVVLRLTVS